MSTDDRQRLQRLENAEIARDTLTVYCRAIDTADLGTLESVLDEGVELTRPDGMRLAGRDATMEFYRAALAERVDHRKHYVTNVAARADGDAAVRLEAYLLVVDQHHGELMLGWGTYAARVAVAAGSGRFTHLQIGLTMPPSPVKGMLDRRD